MSGGTNGAMYLTIPYLGALARLGHQQSNRVSFAARIAKLAEVGPYDDGPTLPDPPEAALTRYTVLGTSAWAPVLECLFIPGAVLWGPTTEPPDPPSKPTRLPPLTCPPHPTPPSPVACTTCPLPVSVPLNVPHGVPLSVPLNTMCPLLRCAP